MHPSKGLYSSFSEKKSNSLYPTVQALKVKSSEFDFYREGMRRTRIFMNNNFICCVIFHSWLYGYPTTQCGGLTNTHSKLKSTKKEDTNVLIQI